MRRNNAGKTDRIIPSLMNASEIQIPVREGETMLKVIAVIGKTAIFVCAFWVVTLLSVLLHELGHALGYMLATGDRHWHIEIGQGKKILKTKALTINMFVIDGFFTPDEDKTTSRAQQVMTISGGPVVSLLIIIGLLVLKFGGSPLSAEVFASGMISALFYAALFINFLILLWSVIPANGFFRGMEDVGTDVMQIINAFRQPRE